MGRTWKIVTVVLLVLAVSSVFALKSRNQSAGKQPAPSNVSTDLATPDLESKLGDLSKQVQSDAKPSADVKPGDAAKSEKSSDPVKDEKIAGQTADKNVPTVENPNKVKQDKKNQLVKPAKSVEETETDRPKVLPKIVDFGRGQCIPCKMMKPVLEELAREYRGKLEVVFIDTGEHPDYAELFRIGIIPTQIFYDQYGEEFVRHEGFFSKEDIMRTFSKRGITFRAGR